ncbi:hypothetical protein ACW95P_00585 [Candidatus Mycoplasma pogonae]
MKKSLKLISSLSAIAVISTATALFVFQPWNTQQSSQNGLAPKTLNYSLVAKAPINTEEKTKLGEVSLVKVAQAEEAQKTEEKAAGASSETATPAARKTDAELLSNIKTSTNPVLDAYLKKVKANKLLEIEEVETLDTTKKADVSINEELGGYGTYNRQRGTYNGKASDNTYNPGGQESTQTMTALIYSKQKFKALKAGATKIKSADFKFVAVNSLVFTGAEILEIDEDLKKAAVKFMNDHLKETIEKSTGYEKQRWEEWKKVAEDRTVENLTQQELTWLKQGMFPTSAFSWGYRPAFVNTYVYEQTKKNLDRFVPVASSSQLEQEKIFNLDFNGNSSTETKNNWTVNTKAIKLTRTIKAYLKTYKNSENEVRHVIEIVNVDPIYDSGEFLKSVKEKIGNSFNGLGVVIRNVNEAKAKHVADVVKKLPNFVKSLTLFYETSNPIAVNALKDNPNFSAENQLLELNIVGPYNNGNPIDQSKVLKTVNPQVFTKVKQSTFSYGTNVIFTKFQVGSEVNKQLLENIFKFVYIKDKDRREFQGEFGSGGYITDWDLSKTQLRDLNNIEFPQLNEGQALKLKSVVFAPVDDHKLSMDLSDLSIDNTDKISAHGSVMYGTDVEKQPTKLVLAQKSKRATQDDINTLVRVLNYSYKIQTIDLSNVAELTQEVVKEMFGEVNRNVTVKTVDGEFTVTAKVKTEIKTEAK